MKRNYFLLGVFILIFIFSSGFIAADWQDDFFDGVLNTTLWNTSDMGSQAYLGNITEYTGNLTFDLISGWAETFIRPNVNYNDGKEHIINFSLQHNIQISGGDTCAIIDVCNETTLTHNELFTTGGKCNLIYTGCYSLGGGNLNKTQFKLNLNNQNATLYNFDGSINKTIDTPPITSGLYIVWGIWANDNANITGWLFNVSSYDLSTNVSQNQTQQNYSWNDNLYNGFNSTHFLNTFGKLTLSQSWLTSFITSLINYDYVFNLGFYPASNPSNFYNATTLPSSSGTSFKYYNITTADITTTNSVSYNATILHLPLTAGKKVSIECNLLVDSAAATTGIQFSSNVSGTSSRRQLVEYYTSATAQAICQGTGEGLLCAATASGGTTTTPTRINIYSMQNILGNFTLRLKSEVAGSAVYVRTGSWCRSIEV